MATQALITLTQNDKTFPINFSLVDATNTAVDLTNATLEFYAQLVSDSSVQFSGSMSTVSATGGTCQYTVGTTDLAVAGTYNAQIVVTYGSGEVITFGNIELNVQERIPISA